VGQGSLQSYLRAASWLRGPNGLASPAESEGRSPNSIRSAATPRSVFEEHRCRLEDPPGRGKDDCWNSSNRSGCGKDHRCRLKDPSGRGANDCWKSSNHSVCGANGCWISSNRSGRGKDHPCRAAKHCCRLKDPSGRGKDGCWNSSNSIAARQGSPSARPQASPPARGSSGLRQGFSLPPPPSIAAG
jgi:hypothetical protein